MPEPLTASTRQALDRGLEGSELAPSACEAQGILCALLCAGAPQAEASWSAELLAGVDATSPATEAYRRSLADLAAHTRARMASLGDFTPLLPDDSAPLAQRALALYDFSRGFLYGLALGGMDTGRLSQQAQEALQDLTAITRLDLDDLPDSEDNEQALMELTEFVRVAAMLLYEGPWKEPGEEQGQERARA